MVKTIKNKKERKTGLSDVDRPTSGRVPCPQTPRDGEAQFSGIIDGSPVPTLMLDADHVITHWNKACENLTRIAASEVVGTRQQWRAFYSNERPIMSDLVVDNVPEDVIARYYGGRYQRSAVKEGAYEAEDFFPDLGEYGRWLFFTAAPLMDETGRITGAVETLQDITERKQTENALRESEDRNKTILDTVQVGIIIVEMETGTIVEVNHAAEVLYALDKQRILGRPYRDFLHSFEGEPGNVADERPTAGVREAIVRQPNGKDVCVLENTVTVMLHGCNHLLISLVDVTERKQLETRVQYAQKLESLGVLAGGTAHEFNNLLQAILGNAALAMQDLSKDSPVLESLADIRLAAKRAAELARQLWVYTGNAQLSTEDINLSKVIKEMRHLTRIAAGGNVVLKYDLAEALPAVTADPAQIRQVLINLVTNAAEAIADRRGRISVTTGTLFADRPYLARTYLREPLPEGPYVFLEVSDSGCGMSEDTLARIFDPFFTTKFMGRGLGLAAVLGIVRGHNGALNVASEPGQGTRVTVLLPCCSR